MQHLGLQIALMLVLHACRRRGTRPLTQNNRKARCITLRGSSGQGKLFPDQQLPQPSRARLVSCCFRLTRRPIRPSVTSKLAGTDSSHAYALRPTATTRRGRCYMAVTAASAERMQYAGSSLVEWMLRYRAKQWDGMRPCWPGMKTFC